jgi:DNA-binding NtrC family response regulator
VIRISLPPLRERKADIPLLIERILANYENRYVLANEALDAMLRYDWPGNVRELKNCMERMVTLNAGPLLQFLDLPTSVVNSARTNSAAGMAAAVGTLQPSVPAHSSASASSGNVVPLHELERRAIEHALLQTRGDRTTAAHLLGIGRTTLYRKLKEYQMANNC